MKSIQTKFLVLILAGILISSVVIGTIGGISLQIVSDQDSVRIMNLISREKEQELNTTLGRIEQSVEILADYALDNLESVNRLSGDSDYLESYTQQIYGLAMTAINETDGAISAYIRFNPELTPPTSGFFIVKDPESGQFIDFEPTDFTRYSPDDVEHVGWYYIPVKEGKPVWMMPYRNENIDVYMISYVIPIYLNETVIGIVGMDIDFSHITASVDEIQLYKTGYAFLTYDDFSILYHRNLEEGTAFDTFRQRLTEAESTAGEETEEIYQYTWDGIKKVVSFRRLDNNMCIAVAAPKAEIDAATNRLIFRVGAAMTAIAVIFAGIVVMIAGNIIRPLKKLNLAAQEIAAGNLDVQLPAVTEDEVGMLSASLQETVKQLKIRIQYINGLAYKDELTRLKNNTAYLQKAAQLNEQMQAGPISVLVAVIDINGLKFVNDSYGHEKGNELIITAAEAVSECFGAENVYRIGGDEFTVILTEEADIHAGIERKRKFQQMLNQPRNGIRLSAAIGIAVYDRMVHASFESVFRSADANMYREKSEMKARGASSDLAYVSAKFEKHLDN